MAFSGGVKLGDLDDFISLSQECVIPLLQAAEGGKAAIDFASDAKLHAKIAEPPQVQVHKPNLIKTKKSKEEGKAEIGQVQLSDCLACSGCVTSAETVLLEAQSGKEFLIRVAESPLTVVTVSSEARTGLADYFNLEPLELMRRLAELLRRFGVAYVVEASAAEAVSLLEGSNEFVRRFRSQQVGSKLSNSDGANNLTDAPLPLLTSHCPGWTCYAEKVVDPVVLPHLAPLRPAQHVQGRLVKTCLLEAHNRRTLHRRWKSRHPLFALEALVHTQFPLAAASIHRSTPSTPSSSSSSPPPDSEPIPSPRTAADPFARLDTAPLTASDVYHVSVQPCFDRKIEAARPLFEISSGIREVDTVLTATELLELIRGAAGGVVPEVDEDVDDAAEVLAAVPEAPLDGSVLTNVLLRDLRIARPQPLISSVRDHAGSGGFLEHIFREAAEELFQVTVGAQLTFKTRQNEDMREVVLEDPKTRQVLLRFVAAYGFRNIQNVIRRLTQGADNSIAAQWAKAAGKEITPAPACGHLVEIMACPGGCLNGGGQIPAADASTRGPVPKAERKTRLDSLEKQLCHGQGVAFIPPAEHPDILDVYSYIVNHDCSEEASLTVKDIVAKPAHDSLKDMVGGTAVHRWLAAGWRSLKVDSEGKAIISTSALKW